VRGFFGGANSTGGLEVFVNSYRWSFRKKLIEDKEVRQRVEGIAAIPDRLATNLA
jgi:hypothetical protein